MSVNAEYEVVLSIHGEVKRLGFSQSRAKQVIFGFIREHQTQVDLTVSHDANPPAEGSPHWVYANRKITLWPGVYVGFSGATKKCPELFGDYNLR